MTRGLLRRGALPRIDRRAPRVASGRARAPMSTPSGMRNRSFADIASVRCALSPGQARLVTCQTQQQTRVVHNKRVSPHTPCRTIPDEIRGGARAGASARSRSALRDRSARPRSDASSPRRRRRVRLGARALWRGAATHAPKLSPRKSHQPKKATKQRARDGSVDSLFACKKEFSSFSNRRAVNSGERLSCASLIARTVTVEHHGGTHADAQRADDCTCGGSSSRAARFVAEPRGHAPRSNARRGASCQIFFVSVAAICAFRG